MSTEDRRSTSAKRRVIPQSQEDLDRAANSVNRARQALRGRNKSTLWDKYSYHIVIGGFALVIIVTVLTTVLGKSRDLKKTPVIEHDEIEAHNAEHTDYKLGENSFFQDQTLSEAKKVLNNFFSYKQSLSRCLADENTILDTTYDFREKYPECTSEIVDQKNCSSSFAVASASAISDRICQATGKHIKLSAQEYLSCQEGSEGKECDGGSIASFLDFVRRKGIVEEKCFPYVGENGASCDKTAESRCDKHRIADYCVAGPQESIKRDIVKNGPSIGYIPVYRDFLVYKNGTFKVTDGVSRFQGGHAVKIVGWGDGHWIIQNSWGKDWGMHGFAHVAFGQEDLMLDEYAFSPNVKTDKNDDVDALRDQPDQVDV